MAVVASWDGATRRIYLAQGVTTFHPIDDIYREYRVWRRTVEAARQWEPFMVAVGNEDKGGGKATPRFLRLLDDGDIGQCKIVPYNEASTIDVTGEVLTTDLSDPFDYSAQTTPTIVRYAPAEAEIVYVNIPSPIQDNLDYSGEVNYDALSGETGTVHPYGTRSNPVNSLADALTIAGTYGLHTLRTHSDITIDQDVSGMTVLPVESGLAVTFSGANIVDGATFQRMLLGGNAIAGAPWFADFCSLNAGLDGVQGNFQSCMLYGLIGVTGDAAFLDCASGVAGVGAAEVDVAGATGAVTVQFRRYTGGLNLYGFAAGDTVSVDLLPGVLRLKATVTGGEFKVRGLGEPIVVDGTPTLLDDDGFNPTDAATVALITEARDEALLGRKLIDADEVLTAGGTGNLTLVDADDGVTVLRTKSVKDASGGNITTPAGVPARKERT